MADVSVLDVLLHGEPIGTITRISGDRTLFTFNEAYIENSNRPVLGLGFKDEFGELITEFRPSRMKLHPFFSNLLPEGHMRTYLAERAGVHPEREFFLLWVLGKDLPGALTVRPADGEAWPPDAREAADEERAAQRANALRFSLAGVQMKFSAVHEVRGGLTIPARGIGGSWIVKLPSQQFAGVPENEFAMMTLAREVGITVPRIELVDIAAINNLPAGMERIGGKALAVERFDRLGDEAIHIEDFAQVFGVYPDDKYQKASYRHIAAVIAAESGEDDMAEFIRRLTFNTLIGNADMHLKNWSIIYPDRRHAALAPAYDLVSTIAFLPDENAALKFSRTKKFREFTEDELAHLAAKALMPEKLVLDTARETAATFRERWQALKNDLPLTGGMIAALEAHLATFPLA
jgi:serine/threonine-protein kinase HipA